MSQHETLLRQWEMLRQIPRYPHKISARTLMERLTSEGYVVSKRTIERDLISLSLTFPLAQDDRDKEYGWSWQKDAPAFDLPALSNSEALTMLMVEQHLTGLLPSTTLDVLKPYFLSAEKQLDLTSKSKKFKSWLSKVRTIQANQTLIPPNINPVVQAIVYEALLLEKQLKIEYKNREGNLKNYRVHILGLVQRGSIIYLNVRINDFENLRMLALHRIQSAELLDDETIYPKGYDIDAEIINGSFDFGEGKLIELIIQLSSEAAKHLFETPLSKDQNIQILENDQVLISVKLVSTPQLKWWLLALGDGVEVLEPLALREDIKSTLQKTIQHYK
jgi:predicted DNA-binding transcriptional regulator YafY